MSCSNDSRKNTWVGPFFIVQIISPGRLFPTLSVPACLVFRLEQHRQENALTNELEAISPDSAYIF
jgi:hypothetical protein